jgi:pyruvate formate lyase activating enzyme
VRHETDVWLEVTTLLIPGLNDDPGELDRLTSWVAEKLGPDVPLHFTAFHPDFRMMDRPPTPSETLTEARSIGLANGLRYVYTGNVNDPAGQSTYCHACGAMLIERAWYRLGEWGLDEGGRCSRCGAGCAGRFDPEGAGDWGPRRQPVRLGS